MAVAHHYVFLSFEKIQQNVSSPIKHSKRVKYTCFHVSHSYIAFGSSSGGVYLFQRCPDNFYQYLLMIVNNHGSVSSVAFCPQDEQVIAVATLRGHLMIFELGTDDNDSSCGWKTIYHVFDFTQSSVNILKWHDFIDYRLYIADESGQVFLLHNVKTFEKLLVVPTPSIILKIGTKIFQFDVSNDLIVISTETRCCLYDLYDATLIQIGKKPRSSGNYGACFFPKEIDEHFTNNCILTARPGLRIWEVNSQGDVQLTHQFKESLSSLQPSMIFNHGEWLLKNCTKEVVSTSFEKFAVLFTEVDYFLVTYSNGKGTSSLYVIDPIYDYVAAWCSLDFELQDVYCIRNEIYILYINSSDSKLNIKKFSLFTLEQYFFELVRNNQVFRAAEFFYNYLYVNFKTSFNKKSLVLKVLKQDIWKNLSDNEKSLFADLDELLEVEENSESRETNHQESLANNQSISSSSKLHQDTSSGNQSPEIHQEVNFNPVAQYFSAYSNNFFDLDKLNGGIDIVDVGMNEFVKLRNNIITKLANAGIKPIKSLQNISENNDGYDNKEFLDYSSSSTEDFLQEKENNFNEEDTESLEELLDKLHSKLKSSGEAEVAKCSCGWPRPFAHRESTELVVEMQDCISRNLQNGYPIETLLKLSFEDGIWKSYISLVLLVENFESYLKVILMLCDDQLLNTDLLVSYLKNGSKVETLFDMFYKQNSGETKAVTCINCSKVHLNVTSDFSWERISMLSVKSLGPDETIKILKHKSHQIPDTSLSTQFYLYLLRMQMITSCQSPVTTNRLAKLKNYIKKVEEANKICSSPPTKPEKGFKLDLNRAKCEKCKLNLVDVNRRSAIVVFDCLHCYHKSCALNQVKCQLCAF